MLLRLLLWWLLLLCLMPLLLWLWLQGLQVV